MRKNNSFEEIILRSLHFHMCSIADLLNRPIALPVVPEIKEALPIMIASAEREIPEIQCEPTISNSSSAPYTMRDDLSIITIIHKYFGKEFTGKIPWSFWQTYKTISKSPRSCSSLYHHWNGSMQKKYKGFLQTGRLIECIKWISSALECDISEQSSGKACSGHPLVQVMSEPPVPIEDFRKDKSIKTRYSRKRVSREYSPAMFDY